MRETGLSESNCFVSLYWRSLQNRKYFILAENFRIQILPYVWGRLSLGTYRREICTEQQGRGIHGSRRKTQRKASLHKILRFLNAPANVLNRLFYFAFTMLSFFEKFSVWHSEWSYFFQSNSSMLSSPIFRMIQAHSKRPHSSASLL